MVSSMPRPHFTPDKHQVPNVHKAVWAPAPVWTGAENLATTGIQSMDREARSQSLYQLSYKAQALSTPHISVPSPVFHGSFVHHLAFLLSLSTVLAMCRVGLSWHDLHAVFISVIIVVESDFPFVSRRPS